MKFPNAYLGIKKLFAAGIISAIGSLLLMGSLITVLFSPTNEALLLVVAVLSVIASVTVIVSLVLQLIGLVEGGKDEDALRAHFL